MTPEQELIQARLSLEVAQQRVREATDLLIAANVILQDAHSQFASVSLAIYGRKDMR